MPVRQPDETAGVRKPSGLPRVESPATPTGGSWRELGATVRCDPASVYQRERNLDTGYARLHDGTYFSSPSPARSA